MKLFIFTSFILVAATATLATAAFAGSPYAGQESRDIKALSSEDVSGYEAGKGMGFAKAAELNGFAGPAHVLELESRLHLTRDQRARTEALFAAMSAKAGETGRLLVGKERELDALFANRTITPAQMTPLLQAIGMLQAQIRDAHLEAHLAQVAILTPEQNALYGQLRGYREGPQGALHRHKH